MFGKGVGFCSGVDDKEAVEAQILKGNLHRAGQGRGLVQFHFEAVSLVFVKQ